MVPMVDTLIPGMTVMVLAIGPATIGVFAALLAGLAWLVSGTAEELRRTAARDREPRLERPATLGSDRLAA